MKILQAYPPNFSRIVRTFPYVRGRPGILYAWGKNLYNPSGIEVPRWLMDHERTHSQQQGDDVPGWWERYMTSSTFRLDQELAAHRIEWDTYRALHSAYDSDMYLVLLSQRLSSKLYGSLLSEQEARREIAGDDYQPDRSKLAYQGWVEGTAVGRE